MKHLNTYAVLIAMLFVPSVFAQSGPQISPAILAARTVILLNETHTGTVEDGAEEELKQWGRLKLTDDLDSADIVLRFSKKSEHETSNSHKTDANGNPIDYSFSITSDSTIHMTATSKDGFAPFYTTETKDGKEKAGKECVQAFIAAWQQAQQKRPGKPQ